MKNLICITCPRGCHLTIDETTLKVSGNFCPRGEKYAQNELTSPKRVLTSSVKIIGAKEKRLSVKTSDAIDKNLIFEVMKILNQVEVYAPITMNQVIIKNILDTGVDIIATKKMEEV
jgi:CxxC motif-containing protein